MGVQKLFFTLLFIFISLTSYCEKIINGHDYSVTATELRIRSKPDGRSDVVGSLQQGDVVRVLNTEKEWAEISQNGSTGYVKSEYLGNAQPTIKRATTFKARFLLGFRFFMIALIGMGSIRSIQTRNKDARFKGGFRLKKPDFGDMVFIVFTSIVICSIIGLFIGVAGFFN